MGKYKIKKRKKAQNPMLIFIIFALCTLLVSCGYAMLSDNLAIIGKAKFKPQIQSNEDEVLDEAALQVGEVFTPMDTITEYANSKYSFENISNIEKGDGTYLYQIKLEITNLEQDFTSGNLEISFEENNGLYEKQAYSNLGITQADKVLISENKVTILLTEVNSIVKYGDKISILAYLTYEYEQPEGISIQNVSLNGKLLYEDNDSSSEKDTSDKTNTDLKNEVNTNTIGTNTVTNTVGNEIINANLVVEETKNQEPSKSDTNQVSENKDEEEEQPGL